MKALVVGIDGMIGAALGARLERSGWVVYGTSRRYHDTCKLFHLDLAQPRNLAELPQCQVAFLCAAETRLAVCRENEQTTKQINVDSPLAISRHLLDRGWHVVFLSTNAVFDGARPGRRAEEPTCPVTAYGRHKAEVEHRLAELDGRITILRLTKVLASSTRLITDWIARLRANLPISPFEDMVMAPVPLDLVTEVLEGLTAARATGIFQLSAARDITFADAARHLGRRLGVDPLLVQPTSSATKGIPRSEVSPHTSLDTSGISALLGTAPPEPSCVLDNIYGPSWLSLHESDLLIRSRNV